MSECRGRMISRKERRVQKALGLGDDIPPTIFFNIQLWVYIKKQRIKCFFQEEFWQWLAFKLPRKLVYHCGIRIWARATTHGSGYGEDVTITTMDDAIRRWEKE